MDCFFMYGIIAFLSIVYNFLRNFMLNLKNKREKVIFT